MLYDEFVIRQEMFLALMDDKTKWLHDRFGLSIEESQKTNKESLIVHKILGFLVNMFGSLVMTILMNASSSKFFKEILALSLTMLSVSAYMLFVSEGGNAKAIMMPWLTSH